MNYLDKLPNLKLSILPTPIHKLETISKLHEVDLWCKRDDLTGFAFGGNKTRKLDLLIADALEQKADTLITVGSNQSNFCRITAAYGSKYGLETHLVLGGKKPSVPTGNLKLDHLLGATIHHFDSEDWDWLEQESKKIADELTKHGKNVYLLPVGGSTPLGSVGYVSAMEEIIDFEKEKNISFNKLFITSGSGGTHAGLLAGKALYHWPGQIIGITISRSADQQTQIVSDLAQKTAKLVGTKINQDWIIIDDNYVGPGYGQKTNAAESAIKTFAQKEGIMLDSYYTGKTAGAILDYISLDKITKGEKILFLHTGGNIQLFE